MSPATEGACIIDKTVSGLRIEKRTSAGRIFGQLGSPGRAKPFGRYERFALREIGCATGQFEMAAFFHTHAIALDRSLRESSVDFTHCIQRALTILTRDPERFMATGALPRPPLRVRRS